MSTRSFIARKTSGGYEGVYCHWDGYPEYNGLILTEHYSDPDKLTKLLSYGDISTLAPFIGEKHDFDHRPPDQTTFYGRDRGEKGASIRATRTKSLQDLMDTAEQCGCEYFYLFENDKWTYAARGPQFFGLSDGSPFSEFVPVEIT